MKRSITKLSCLPAMIMLAILLFRPIPANAGIGDIIKGGASFGGCVAAGQSTPYLTDKINEGLNQLKGLVAKIPKIGKFLGGAGSATAGKVPVDDQDLQDLYKSKEYTQDVMTRCAAIEIMNHLNVSIINLARTGGRDGGTTWVTNWRNFQTDAQYRGEGIFRAVLSNTKLCNYFDKEVKSLFGANNKTSLTGKGKLNTRTGNSDPYALRANCTLPSGFSMTSYQQDFAGNGGWDAWSRLLEPQNNYYGALFQSLDEANKQKTLEESSDLNQVLANSGFTGKSGQNANDSCLYKDISGKCLAYKKIGTPGSVIAGGVNASTKSELELVISADEVNELLSTAVNVLLNRLSDLSNPNEGDYISPNIGNFNPNSFTAPEPPSPEEPLPPEPTEFGNVTVNFEIINDNGGTATAEDFYFTIDGELTAAGLARVLPVGEHVISSGPPPDPDGYTFVGITGDCNGGILVLEEGQNAVCTITWNDN